MNKFYRVNEVAALLKVSPSTVRAYTNEGKLQFDRTPAGQRVFTQEHVDAFLGVKSHPDRVVQYVRSSQGKQEQLDAQSELLTEAYGVPLFTASDKASGLSEKRRGLERLIKAAQKGEYDTLVITQKDRLTRFGYTYLEKLFETLGVKIVVLGETAPKSLHDELLQDFMSLVASFSGKYYRLRGFKQRTDLLKLAEKEICEKQ